VGSQQWYSWLSDEENGSFYFVNETGSFTARKERRKRGGWYWIAYRSREGRLMKTYIGRSEDLTLERLHAVTSQLSVPNHDAQSASLPAHPIMAAKFAPPPLAMRTYRMVERKALLERLEASLRVRLTLIMAPAGFGKTTLLNMWYEQCKRQKKHPVAWVTLDERDNDPSRYWSAIWNALHREQKREDIDLSMPLYSTPQMSIESVLAALLNSQPGGVLMLDDYHAITNPQIHEAMEMFLTHLPPDMHVVISSRSEPPLALGRARMYGELLELRIDDLRLSEGEIEAFLRETMGITLSADERALLEQRTEGWVAGLYLVGLALRGQQRPDDILQRLSGSQRSLFDYFAEEVFAHQPVEVQRFLLSTAMFPELTSQLCAAITDEDEVSVQNMLAYIERANIFVVPLDEQRRCYRYHALFREFLQEKLKRSTPELIVELQRRAACWYEQLGMLEEAIEYALAANDIERSTRLIERVGEEILWRKGEVRRLLTWLQQLPSSAYEENLHLLILYAWALLLGGRQDQEDVEALLETIESRAEEQMASALRGDIAALHARLAAFRNDVPQSRAFSRQALQELPKERALLRADVAFAMGGAPSEPDESYRLLSEALHISQALGSLRTAMFSSRYLASTCLEQGRMTEAEAILQQALHLAGETEQVRVPATGVIHIGLAELHYERNELAEALRHATVGIELGERSGEIKVLLSGYCVLALIYAAQGEIERGWQNLWKSERVAMVGRVAWLREQRATIAIHLALLQHDIGGAKRALLPLDIDPDAGPKHAPGPENADERLMLAKIWLAEEKYDAVLELLEPAAQLAQQHGRIKTLLATLAMEAIAANRRGERQRAGHIVSEIVSAGGSEGYMRIFLDAGEPMLDLLQQVDVPGRARVWTRKLLEAFESSRGGRKSEAAGLSEREYEVLQLVASGMSNQEIAEALIIAVSTAKAHVKHICQKLGVQTRVQAVAKARELELI
jgi:LuxR family maltose regulon positive regulatory protein